MIELGPGALLAAFAAGFLSFVSPCVLPLVPGYLSFVSGVSFDEVAARPRRVTAKTAAFVLGFGATFVALGAGAAWFGSALVENRRVLELVGGGFIVLAGLVYAGVPLPRFVLAERRPHVGRAAGTLAPTVAGAAFAVGWSPCIGPTLAAILALAAAKGGAAEGAVLLGVYSLGLGVPFLAAGLAFTRALAFAAFLRRHRRAVGLASGATLVGFGVLLATGELLRLSGELARFTGLAI